MLKRVIAVQLLLLLLEATLIAAVSIPPTDPDIRYTGRWNFDDPSIPWVGWQGSSIMVKFEGTGLLLSNTPPSEEYTLRVALLPLKPPCAVNQR